jgi:hypothetical protein
LLALQRSQQALGWLSEGSSSCARESMRLSPLKAGHDPRVKEGIMRPRHRLQWSLFEEDRKKTSDIPASGRSTLIRLIEGLLVEALADGAKIETGTPTTEMREGRSRKWREVVFSLESPAVSSQSPSHGVLQTIWLKP